METTLLVVENDIAAANWSVIGVGFIHERIKAKLATRIAHAVESSVQTALGELKESLSSFVVGILLSRTAGLSEALSVGNESAVAKWSVSEVGSVSAWVEAEQAAGVFNTVESTFWQARRREF